MVRGNQVRVKNADLRHPYSTILMHRRKSASPVHNVLTVLLRTSRLLNVKHKPGVDVQITVDIKHLHCQLPLITSKTYILRNLELHSQDVHSLTRNLTDKLQLITRVFFISGFPPSFNFLPCTSIVPPH